MPCFIASGDRIFLLIAVVLGEAVFREVLEIDRAKKPQLITKRATFRVKRKYPIKSIRYSARRFLLPYSDIYQSVIALLGATQCQ